MERSQTSSNLLSSNKKGNKKLQGLKNSDRGSGKRNKSMEPNIQTFQSPYCQDEVGLSVSSFSQDRFNLDPSCFSFDAGLSEDCMNMRTQLSGDVISTETLAARLKYPRESNLLSLSMQDSPQPMPERVESYVCIHCQEGTVCTCNTNLKTTQCLTASKSNAFKFQSYQRLPLPNEPFRARTPQKHLKVQNSSSVYFWFHFFVVSLVLATLVYYLVLMARRIVWPKKNIIQVFLSGSLFWMGTCWLLLVNFCHRSDLGYKFSRMDYILTICSSNMFTIPWILASFHTKLKIVYCGLISLFSALCVFAKVKESPSIFIGFIRKSLFVLHTIVGFWIPIFHYTIDKEKYCVMYSICAWLAILTSIYATALLMNKFYNQTQIYVDSCHSILLFEVLRVFHVVSLAMSIIQLVNIYKLLKYDN